MKKGFILYNDSLQILDDLTNEQAGLLFKAIKDYNSGIENELDIATKMLFLHFKNQFIRDGIKYENKSKVNSSNGSKGGLAKVANATKRNKSLKFVANVADTDTITDTDTKIDFSVFWGLYPRKEGKPKAKEKFDKLPKETQQKIINSLPSFLKGKELKYIPMPVTYLNNQRWDDELNIEPTLTDEQIKQEKIQNFLSRL